MERNCDLELRLATPCVHSNGINQGPIDDGDNGGEKEEKPPLTIFYDGKIAACDVTELRARTIISLAMSSHHQETEARNNRAEIIFSPTSLSTKKSLQRFLEKRKTRACASASPYCYPIAKSQRLR